MANKKFAEEMERLAEDRGHAVIKLGTLLHEHGVDQKKINEIMFPEEKFTVTKYSRGDWCGLWDLANPNQDVNSPTIKTQKDAKEEWEAYLRNMKNRISGKEKP